MKAILKLNTMALLVLGAMLVFPFQSCKKGADDPAISFRSRKARIVGEWTVKEVRENGSVQSMQGTNTYTFKKDGTGSNVIKNGGFSFSTDFRWDFLGGVGDYKKKERIIVYQSSSTDGTVIDLLELRNKSMTWLMTEGTGNSKDETVFTLEQ